MLLILLILLLLLLLVLLLLLTIVIIIVIVVLPYILLTNEASDNRNLNYGVLNEIFMKCKPARHTRILYTSSNKFQ